MKSLAVVLLSLWTLSSFADATPEYKRLQPECKTCVELDKLLSKHSLASSDDEKLDIALKIAGVIEKTDIKGKPEPDQRRAIYFSINSTVEVLDDDFDSETVADLIELRAQAPKVFDYILWRFPMGNQKRIIERMQALKDDDISPKAEIPVAKAVDL